MRTLLPNFLPITGIICLFIFSVSATASLAGPSQVVDNTFSEPINMVLIGFGLIGISSFLSKKLKPKL
jgi:hypothetical protein